MPNPQQQEAIAAAIERHITSAMLDLSVAARDETLIDRSVALATVASTQLKMAQTLMLLGNLRARRIAADRLFPGQPVMEEDEHDHRPHFTDDEVDSDPWGV